MKMTSATTLIIFTSRAAIFLTAIWTTGWKRKPASAPAFRSPKATPAFIGIPTESSRRRRRTPKFARPKLACERRAEPEGGSRARPSKLWGAPPIQNSKKMMAISRLSGAHLRTYKTIFQHPIAHSLGWHDVHALFRQLGEVEEEANGNLKVTRNGNVMFLQPPRTKDVAETDELMSLRHFLERSDMTPRATNDNETHWLLVIDHHEARIFRSEMSGAVPERILPHQPENDFRHAPNSKEFSRGQEKPGPKTFFAPVAKALQAARQILIFGSGTGKSSEMEKFITWLKVHHAELAKRIIGSLVVDKHHLTEGQLLARAREFYANLAAPAAAQH